MPITQTSSSRRDEAKGEGERVRFVGRHSKDNFLSIYLQKRNIVENDGGNGRSECEPLGCIVRVNRERASELSIKGQVVVVGVLARLVCDFGLQYTEHALYQLETRIFPPTSGEMSSDRRGGVIFDRTSRFVTSLPDEWHLPLLIRLPTGLPPSVMMRGAGGVGAGINWGLTWYVFAYVASEQAVNNTLVRHGVGGAWPRLRIGRRHSKVFLSFGKTTLMDASTLLNLTQTLPAPAGTSRRRTLLGGSSPLLLEAHLDRPIYRVGDPINVAIKLRNNGRHRVSGLRITVKQLISVKYGNEPKHLVKTTIREYDVADFSARNQSSYDTIFTVSTATDALRPSGYQLAMECQLPRRDDTPPTLSASSIFLGLHWSRSESCAFGIDRLRLFSVEYYINVHAVIPWASNVIVKLPFRLASSNSSNSHDSSPLSDALHPPLPLQYPPEPVKGNLISFDLEQEHEHEHGINPGDDFELEEEGAAASYGGKGETLMPPVEAHAHEEVTWLEDVRLARETLDAGLADIRDAHYNVMESPLDRRSLALQYSSRRREMNRRLVEHINAMVTHDLPRLKSSMELAERGGSGSRALKRFFAAQATASRLVALALVHAPLVSLSHALRQQREERLEVCSRIVDDFELFLARAQRAAADAVNVLERISDQLLLLVSDIVADCPTIERSLQCLYGTLLSLKFASMASRRFGGEDGDDDLEDYPAEEVETELEPEDNRDALLAAMAAQFQQLYSFVAEDGEPCGFVHFSRQFVEYIARLQVLLASDLPRKSLCIVAYFHWRFLFAIAECYYLGSVGSTAGRLLFLDIRDGLRWSRTEVEQHIPARFLLSIKPDEEIKETAAQIVAVMQRL